MTNTMRSRGNAGQPCTDDGNFRSAEVGVRWRRGRREELVEDPLKDGIEKLNWVEGHDG